MLHHPHTGQIDKIAALNDSFYKTPCTMEWHFLDFCVDFFDLIEPLNQTSLFKQCSEKLDIPLSKSENMLVSFKKAKGEVINIEAINQ